MSFPVLEKKIRRERARTAAVALLGTIVVLITSALLWGAIVFIQKDAGNLQILLQKMIDIIDASRDQFPLWLRSWLPDSVEALRELIVGWLKAHTVEAKSMGQEAGRNVIHILLGMVVGAIIALGEVHHRLQVRPLATALMQRVNNFTFAFEQIVFAQLRIAGLNAILVAVYVIVILPAFGIKLPFSKSLVAVTLLTGLLPIIGNLVSNTMLVIISLSHSLELALISLVFMMVVHKLEYFLNAKIIGTRIHARMWELLVAMLVMEAVFGLPGLICAPVYYAYLKKELSDKELV